MCSQNLRKVYHEFILSPYPHILLSRSLKSAVASQYPEPYTQAMEQLASQATHSDDEDDEYWVCDGVRERALV